MIRNNIFTLSIVLLASLSAVSFANAQILPYIETDKYLYHYGDEIQITAYLTENNEFFPEADIWINNKISGEIVMATQHITMSDPYIINHTHPTIIVDPYHEITFPSDGIYEIVVRYFKLDFAQVTVIEEILYVEFPFNVIDRFDGIDGTDEAMDIEITRIDSELTITQQAITDLQNTPTLPPDLLDRIDTLEEQVTAIATIQENQNNISTTLTSLIEQVSDIQLKMDNLDTTIVNQGERIIFLETNLITLQLQQTPTNEELQISIVNHSNEITALENKPSVDLTPLDTRISQLENNPTNLTPLENRVTTLEDNPTDLIPLENRVTTLEDNPVNLTPLENDIMELKLEIDLIPISQDSKQNIRIDIMYNQITGLQTDINSNQQTGAFLQDEIVDIRIVDNYQGQQLQTLRTDLDAIGPHYDDTQNLRLTSLETKHTVMVGDIDLLNIQHNEDVTNLQSDVDDVELVGNDTEQRTSSLEQIVGRYDTVIFSWIRTVGVNQADITTFQELVGSLQNGILGMQEQINWNENMINKYLPVR